jgi:1-acyl-sn-glycerol-3-phosphate acyltransferase
MMVRIVQIIIIVLLRPFLYLLYRPRLSGVDLVREPHHPILFVANHSNYIDAFLLALLPWRLLRRTLPIYYPTTSVFMGKWHYRALLAPMGAYTMYRWSTSLAEYLKDTLAHLTKGNSVLLFPEGGHVEPGKRKPGKPGIGYIAHHVSELHIIPLHITFTEGATWFGSRLTLALGSEITERPAGDTPQDFRQFADTVLDTIYQL